MYLSAVSSFILYSLVFLRLRGNLLVVGCRIRFRSVDQSSAWKIHRSQDANDVNAQLVAVAKHMLLYPVSLPCKARGCIDSADSKKIAYTILILPISAVRFAEWTGHEVPLGPVIFRSVLLLHDCCSASLV